MKAVILAAGEGKRMYPLTDTRPKVMLPVANKPIAEHLLVELRESGIQEILFVVGHHSEKIREHFEDGARWGVRVTYATQKRQMGTADAVRQVAWWVDGTFLLANGDILLGREDVIKMVRRSEPAMVLKPMEDTSGLGVVETLGSRVVRIHEKEEKPPTNLVNTGIYVLPPDVFSAVNDTRLSRRGEYELTDSLQLLIDRGIPLNAHIADTWYNFTYPWDLLEANRMLLENAAPDALAHDVQGKAPAVVEPGASLKGMVSLGAGSVVRAGSYIIGPVVIGDNCDIGPNCYIRPWTAIGNDCHVGAAVEIKNSIIMNGTKIPHQNYVGDSIVGEGCNLGAGTKIANLRLDHGDIACMGVNSKRTKLGAIIGDHVQTGINSSINVGSAIGSGSAIGPGALVKGMILPHSVIM